MNKSTVSWALYDISNTVFNLGVVGLFLPLWINKRQGTTDADLGFPIAISMIVVLIASPLLGAFTDQSSNRIRIFTFLNMITVVSIFLIGFSKSIPITMGFFGIAFVCVYLAELLYNAMLEQASNATNRGKIGGIGIGLGDVASLIVIIYWYLYGEPGSNYNYELRILAGIFLLAALPIAIFFVEPYKHSNQLKKVRNSILKSIRTQIKHTLTHFRQYPKIPKFFLARYFYMITVNTAGLFVVLYGIKTIGFTEKEVLVVFFIGAIFAIPGAVSWGLLVDKFGPALALKWNMVGWTIFLAGAVSIPWLNLDNQLWWPMSAFIGLCYGGLWAADRPLLMQLSPTKLGEMFGMYGVVSRLAYLTGAVMWPLIADKLGLGQPAAICFLLFCNVVGLVLISKYQNSTV